MTIMNVLTGIFYLIGIIPFAYEILVFKDTKYYIKLMDKNVNEIAEEITPEKTKEEKHVLGCISVMTLIYVPWCLIGLFTFQWYAFFIILMMSLISKKKSEWYAKIDAFISILIISFIFINKTTFHLTALDIFYYFVK